MLISPFFWRDSLYCLFVYIYIWNFNIFFVLRLLVNSYDWLSQIVVYFHQWWSIFDGYIQYLKYSIKDIFTINYQSYYLVHWRLDKRLYKFFYCSLWCYYHTEFMLISPCFWWDNTLCFHFVYIFRCNLNFCLLRELLVNSYEWLGENKLLIS